MRAAFLLVLGVVFLTACAGNATWKLDSVRSAASDEVLLAAVQAGEVPGAVALVTTRDSVLYHRAFGLMDPTGNVRMRPDAIFRIASMTKPITSVGVMMLVEDELLGLDDPASRYLPELIGRQVLVSVDSIARSVTTRPASRDVTIRDLLRHTAGIGYVFSNDDTRRLAEHTDIPPRMNPLLHDPGARWTYGAGTAQLGWIIEAVTGQPLSAFFEDRIFGPLGMDDTSFKLPREKAPRLVAQYRRQDGQLTARSRPDSISGGAGRGDGGLLSTAEDYARFLQLILGHGERAGVRLLSDASIAEMTRNQLEGMTVEEQPTLAPAVSAPFPLGAGRDGFGLGFQVALDGQGDGRPVGSLSWAGINNTHFWIDEQNGIGVALLFQLQPFYDAQVINVLRNFERTLYGVAPLAKSKN